MSTDFYTQFLVIWLCITLIFPAMAIWFILKIKRLNKALMQKDFIVRHYEEMLYAAKDGYLTSSAYKNKEYVYCSRRLATILNLKNGENSTIDEIFDTFSTIDSQKLHTLFSTLKKNGIGFETLVTSKNQKTLTITGVRINSADMDVSSNCLWFRDITPSTTFIDNVTNEAYNYRKQLEDYRILIDNIPTPIWLRDDKLNVTALNRGYLNLLGLKSFSELTKENSVLHDLGNTTDMLELAKTAKQSNTPQKKQINILSNGDLKRYEITENPYYDTTLKTSHTIGSLIDITEFDEAKRNYKVHLDSHLEILSALDTAFCIINTKHYFTFANSAFLSLWNLPQNFIDTTPHYNLFLDKIRESKTLPEVSDFRAYKEEENKAFDDLTEQKEDLLYIPDGRTVRRIRAPHPDGTLIAYEDITESLAAARQLNDLLALKQNILDNISDSILIFSPSLKLTYYNPAYLTLWNLKATDIKSDTNLNTIIDLQQKKLPDIDDWPTFRDDMQKHLTACLPFNLKLKNKQNFTVTPVMLTDSSLMITYHKE